MEKGIEPDVRKYLLKILHSFSYGVLWITGNITAGFYFGLAFRNEKPIIFMILFYCELVVTLIFLLRYFFRTWKK